MNTKRNLIGLSFKSHSEKRDTFLRRSGVQTPAQGTSQPSRVVAPQPSQGTSQPSQAVASQPFRGMSQPSQVTSQEPSWVMTSKQRSERKLQFSRVTVQQPSLVVALQPTRVTVPQPTRVTVPEATHVTVPEPTRVTVCQPFQGMALQHFQGTSQFSWVVVSQPSHGTSQPAHVMIPQLSLQTSQLSRVVAPHSSRGKSQPARVVTPQPSRGKSQPPRVVTPQPSRGKSQPARVVMPQPSRGTSQPARVVTPQPSWGKSQPARVVTPQPSRGMSQPSRVSASLASPPAPPAPTPTPLAQPCSHRLSNSQSRGHRPLQQRCSPVREGISSAENDQFRRPRAKLDVELAGGAEGSRGTAMPLPSIRPPAAAATGPASIHIQPNKLVVPKNPAPPPREKKVRWAPQAGTGPLPNSRLCTSQQEKLQPQQPRKSSPTRNRGCSIRNPGKAAKPDPEAAVPTTKYRINLSADATWLLLRRHWKNEQWWINPFINTGLLLGSQSRADLDPTSFMKISLLNDQNRYDDEEYEEDPAPGVVDEELVSRCMEWLRGAEKAKQEDRLGTLPHLYDH